jgi:hypothetical protein
LIRDDLHPAIVRLLLQTMIKEHGGPGIFNRAAEFPTSTDADFPMAESAVDFYKNGPSLLSRYLPFWLVPHVQRLLAVLLAAGAIVYPLFHFVPKLYQWLLQDRMRDLYRRLRIVEDASQTELTAPQVVSLQTELENIDRTARSFHSDTRICFLSWNTTLLSRVRNSPRVSLRCGAK